MTPETGKRIVDYLLDLYKQNTSDFVNQDTKALHIWKVWMSDIGNPTNASLPT